MTTYSWPSNVIPSSSALTWLDNTVDFVSPLSGTVRTQSRSGGRWSLQLTVSNLKNSTGASNPLHELEAFLFRLNGKTNRAEIPDHAYLRSGPGGGTPRVTGSSQTGLTLLTDGWTTSGTVLYAGDRIGLTNGQMIPVASDVTASSGNATITLAHPILTAPTDNSLIEITAPTAVYVLTNKVSPAATPGVFKTVMVQFEEAIPG